MLSCFLLFAFSFLPLSCWKGKRPIWVTLNSFFLHPKLDLREFSGTIARLIDHRKLAFGGNFVFPLLEVLGEGGP